jgi:hypothetical protein
MEHLIREAARRSARYLEALNDRSVAPPPEAVVRLEGFDVLLQQEASPRGRRPRRMSSTACGPSSGWRPVKEKI